MKIDVSGKTLEVTLHPFNFWECHKIGFDIISDERDSHGYPIFYLNADFTLEEAQTLIKKLQECVDTFIEMEENCQKYFKEQKENGK